MNNNQSSFRTVLILQAVGWGIYFIISAFFHSFFVHSNHDEMMFVKQSFTFSLLGFIFSFLLYFIYEHLKTINLKPIYTLAIVLIASYLVTLFWMVFYKLANEEILGYTIKRLTWINLHHFSFDKTFVLLIWSGIYYIISYWSQLKMEQEKVLRADIALNEAKYNMLKYQVNPHFLFNSLNSIIGMIDEDTTKAKNMVSGLSEFFRYSLDKGSKSTVTLDEEIEGINNYLEIEKQRFENNLKIELNISEEAGKQFIPGFIVHPLVENALKFGMKTSDMPLSIIISAHYENSTLLIKVINSGKLFEYTHSKQDDTQSTSIGIKNISDRLNLTYGDKSTFSLEEKDGMVEASISIRNNK